LPVELHADICRFIADVVCAAQGARHGLVDGRVLSRWLVVV
jgi:hypothetical protein